MAGRFVLFWLIGLAMVGAVLLSMKRTAAKEDRAVLDRWLLCEECTDRQLEAVQARVRRDRMVPLLDQALKGPPIRSRDNVRRQLEMTYERLARRAATQGRTLPLTRDEYVSHYLGNYIATYQSRAIAGLVAIGTPEAKQALSDASNRVRVGTSIYRRDVIQELTQAAPGAWSWITAGVFRSCGITTDLEAYCWGRNEFGQLGDGTTQNRLTPARIAGNLRFDSLVAGPLGLWHTCGVAAQRAFCWGRNASGELGDGSTDKRTVPTPVSGRQAFVGIAIGGSHTCGWTTTNQAYCWGANTQGQLGDGTREERHGPVGLPTYLGLRSVRAGAYHTCGDSLNGQVFCWGLNADGQLGDGSNTTRLTPAPVAGTLRFKALSVGEFHGCALAREGAPDGGAFCVGRNGAGELGDGSTSPRSTLVPVSGGYRFQVISAGRRHTCGIVERTGSVRCWGDNTYGQLGDGSTIDRKSPVSIVDSLTLSFVVLSAGADHTCGITVDHKAYCWGLNTGGQLGDGTMTTRLTPTPVQSPQ